MKINKECLKDKSQYLLIFVPMLAVYLPTVLYPVTDQVGNDVSFRPPGYVFAIVWPILLLLLGISWFVRRKNGFFINSIYSVLCLLLAFWFILYDTNKYFGLVDILVSLLVTIFLIFYKFKQFNKKASLTLVPLAAWLIFASVLNFFSI